MTNFDDKRTTEAFAAWVKKAFKTKTEASEYFGMSLTNFSKYLKGERRITASMQLKTLQRGFDLGVLGRSDTSVPLSLLRPIREEVNEYVVHTVRVPYYTEKVNAGVGVPVESPTSFERNIDRSLVEDPKNAFCVHCSGSSMARIGIMDGSFLICSRVSGAIERLIGKVVIANLDGVTYVKRLLGDTDSGYYILRSEAIDKLPDITVNEHNNLIINGIVLSSHTDIEKTHR